MSEANSCRHFQGLSAVRGERSACAMGRDPLKWVERICGDTFGVFFKIPCTKQSEKHQPCFDCPALDRKTDAEIEQERAENRASINAAVAALPALNQIKQDMIEKKQAARACDCVWCGEAGALSVYVNIGGNNHMHAKCRDCGKGIME